MGISFPLTSTEDLICCGKTGRKWLNAAAAENA